MPTFNTAYHTLFQPGRLTLGLMTPLAHQGKVANMDDAFTQAREADQLGFAALWTRDVPLMIPQGTDNSVAALDDPFLWLAGLASVTSTIALGTAAIVLPLRHPLHVAKTALSLNRISRGRVILGLGSGDRPEEFASFGEDLELRRETYRERWELLRAALSPDPGDRTRLLEHTGGYDLMEAPSEQIPMIVVGSSRQSVQWIAAHSEAWVTYHRPETRQQSRIGLWRGALDQSAGGADKPFVQSMQLDLLEEASAPPAALDLGIRTGRHAFLDYLLRLKELGVGHVMLHLPPGDRPLAEVVQELGEEIIPKV